MAPEYLGGGGASEVRKYALPPLKKRVLPPLKLYGFYGELLTKWRGLQGLLRLSFVVDLAGSYGE